MEDGLQTKGAVKPSGSFRWVICAASFVCLGINGSIMNSYSIMLSYLIDHFEHRPNKYTRFELSLPGSVDTGVASVTAIICPYLIRKFGMRFTAVLGAIFATIGLYLSAYAYTTDHFDVKLMCLTYGVIFGFGFCLNGFVATVIITRYFDKDLGVASSIATGGDPVFTILMPAILPHLLSSFDLSVSLKVLSVMSALLIVISLIFVEKQSLTVEKESNDEDHLSEAKKWSVWEVLSEKRLALFLASQLSIVFGSYAVYAHTISYSNETFKGYNGDVLMTYTACFAIVGRLIFGRFADIENVTVVSLQLTASFGLGLITFMFPFAPNYYTLAILACLFGIFDGSIWALYTPLVVELIGTDKAVEVMGLTSSLYIVPIMGGPIIAGHLYDVFKSYTVPFLLSSFICLMAAVLLIPVAKETRKIIQQRLPELNIQDSQETDDRNSIALLNNHKYEEP